MTPSKFAKEVLLIIVSDENKLTMDSKIKVTICLGSSCFSRKNRDVVTALQEFIANKNLGSKVSLKGGHCFGKCSLGPIMIVDEQLFAEINPQKAVAIVESFVMNKS